MTVADIREFINQEMKGLKSKIPPVKTNDDFTDIVFWQTLKNIRDMLYQLDDRPKAKWVEKDIEELECSNCGTISEFGLEKYCWSCGCEMIDIVLKDDKERE